MSPSRPHLDCSDGKARNAVRREGGRTLLQQDACPRPLTVRVLVTLLAAGLAVVSSARPVGAQENGARSSIRVVEYRGPGGESLARQPILDLSHDEIRAVQKALRQEGYVGVGWTGRLDEGTRKALERLQEERGLVVCGCVSYETVVALGLRPVVIASIPAPGAAPPTSTSVANVEAGLIYPIPIPYVPPYRPPCADADSTPCGGGIPGDSASVGIPAGSAPAAGEIPVPATPGVRPVPADPRIRH